MRKIKIVTLVILVLCMMSAAMIGCTKKEQPPAPYDDSGFTGTTNSESLELETDSFIHIDGKLDEAAWQNKKYFDFTRGNVRVRTTTAFGDMGFYIGMIVSDPHVYANEQRLVWWGSSVEVYIDRGDALVKSKQTFQYRLSALNKVEMTCGWSSPELDWADAYRPVYGLSTVQGELNSGNTEGMTAEIFVRWDALGYDYTADDFEAPTTVRLLPVYNSSTGPLLEDERAEWCGNIGSNLHNVQSYWVFDNDGFTLSDRAGAVVGDASIGRIKTTGWDISDEADGSVTTTVGGRQYIYFTDVNAENYMFTTTVEYNGNNATDTEGAFTPDVEYPNGDPWPKVGLLMGAASNDWMFVVDYNAGRIGANGFGMFFRDSPWYVGDECRLFANTGEKIRLTGVKYGTMLLVFAGNADTDKFGGTLVALRDEPQMNGKAVPGFFTLGGCATFSDYEATTDTAAINARIEGSLTRFEVEQTSGGAITGAQAGYRTGDAAILSVETYDGFRLTSLKVNEQEKLNELDMGVLRITTTGSLMTVKPVFERITDARYAVTGKLDMPASVVSSGVEIFIKKSGDNTMAYRLAPAPTGVWAIALPDGAYAATVRYNGGFAKDFAFAVNGAAVTVDDVVFSPAVFDSEDGVSYEDDGSIVLQKNVTRTFAGVEATEGFAMSFALRRTDGVDNENGTWSTGGLAVKKGSETFRIFVMRADSDVIVYVNRELGGWAQKEYRYTYAYSGTGAPIRLSIAYLDATYYILLNDDLVARLDKNTAGNANPANFDMSTFFAAGARSIGLCAVDVPVAFSAVNYALGDEAARAAIAGMKADIIVSETPNGTVSVDDAHPWKGENATVTVRPDSGYEVDTFTVDGADQKEGLVLSGDTLAYTIVGATGRVTVAVTFKQEAPRHTVTGKYAYAAGLFGAGDSVDVTSGAYVGTAANGTFNIDLPAGIHTITLTSARFRSVQIADVTVGDGAVALPDEKTAMFTTIRFSDDTDVSYGADGSITLNSGDFSGNNTLRAFSGVTAQAGFTVRFDLTRTDGNLTQSYYFHTGGLSVTKGGNTYRMFVMQNGEGDIRLIVQKIGALDVGNRYAYAFRYSGTGAPLTMTVAYVDGAYYILLESEADKRAVKLDIDTPDDGDGFNRLDMTDFYAAGARSFGLFAGDGPIRFTDVSYALGDDAARAAIAGMRVQVSKNETTNGTVSLDDDQPLFGSDVTVTVSPANDYLVDTFTVDGVDRKSELTAVAGGYAYVIRGIRADVRVEATFIQIEHKYAVTGTYSNVGANETVSLTAGSIGGTAANGSFTIDLPDGTHTLLFTSASHGTVRKPVTVSGGAVSVGDVQFAYLGNDDRFVYNADGSVSMKEGEFACFKVINAQGDQTGDVTFTDQFEISMHLVRTDGDYTQDGWTTGGVGVLAGGTLFKIFIQQTKCSTSNTIAVIVDGGGKTVMHRFDRTIVSSGAPMTLRLAFCDGKVYGILQETSAAADKTAYTFVLNRNGASGDAAKLYDGSQTKLLGVCTIDRRMTFADVRYGAFDTLPSAYASTVTGSVPYGLIGFDDADKIVYTDGNVTISDAMFYAFKTLDASGNATGDVKKTVGFELTATLRCADGDYTRDNYNTGGFTILPDGGGLHKMFIRQDPDNHNQCFFEIEGDGAKRYTINHAISASGAPMTIGLAFTNGKIYGYVEELTVDNTFTFVLDGAEVSGDAAKLFDGVTAKMLGVCTAGQGMTFTALGYNDFTTLPDKYAAA